MKFAHISDCHLGAWQHNEELCKLNLQAFLIALDICLTKKVDFVLIAGDLLNTPTPDLAIVESAVRKMKELKDSGVEFYMILGSHDYSPNVRAITDVLSSAGFIAPVMHCEERDGRLVLNCIRDPKTGAILAGLSGKRRGEDAEDFLRLDTHHIQREKGFKLFAFHNYLSGIAPSEIPGIPSLPLENLPRGFDYYAGGHPHKKQQYDSQYYRHVVPSRRWRVAQLAANEYPCFGKATLQSWARNILVNIGHSQIPVGADPRPYATPGQPPISNQFCHLISSPINSDGDRFGFVAALRALKPN